MKPLRVGRRMLLLNRLPVISYYKMEDLLLQSLDIEDVNETDFMSDDVRGFSLNEMDTCLKVVRAY